MPETNQLAFTLDEYRDRLRRVQHDMRERGLDVLVVLDRANICYLTGMENCYMTAFYAAVVPASDEPILVASQFEMLNARLSSWCEAQATFPVGGNPIETLCRAPAELGCAGGRIGLERHVMSAARYEEIRERLPQAQLVEAGDLVPRLKAIKSAREIDYLRQAGQQSSLGMEAALARATVGASDNDVAAAAYQAMLRAGSEFPCIDPIVTVGQRSGVPHTTFRRTTIEPGDCVLIEVGGAMCRYSAPMMRTAAAQPVDEKVREAAAACRTAVESLIENMRPGAVAREVAAKAKVSWTPICEELLWHGIYAYSVGLGFPPDWNDTPLCITEGSDLVLQVGMCFHASASLRLPHRFGTAVSETVLITERGNEVLTSGPRELRVV